MSPLYLYLQVLILLIIALILTNYNYYEKIIRIPILRVALDGSRFRRRAVPQSQIRLIPRAFDKQ